MEWFRMGPLSTFHVVVELGPPRGKYKQLDTLPRTGLLELGLDSLPPSTWIPRTAYGDRCCRLSRNARALRAVAGAGIKREHADRLRELDRTLVIVPDNDEAGAEAAVRWREVLLVEDRVRVLRLP